MIVVSNTSVLVLALENPNPIYQNKMSNVKILFYAEMINIKIMMPLNKRNLMY